jgi:hypothetical protein
MAYDIPTAAQLKALFPAFAAVADATVDAWIVRAGRSVDTTWFEEDFTHGHMLLAAHYMVTNGLGTGAAAEAAAAGADGFKVMRSGSLTLERFENKEGAAASEFGSTSYGLQFLALAKRNRGGPRVMGTGVFPPPYPPVGSY